MADPATPSNPAAVRPVSDVTRPEQQNHSQAETPTTVGPNPNRNRFVYIHRVDQYFGRILARFLRRQRPGSAGADQLAEDDTSNNDNEDDDKASVFDAVVAGVAGANAGGGAVAGGDAASLEDNWRIIGSIYDPCRATIEKSRQLLDEINANQNSKTTKDGATLAENGKMQGQIDLADKACSPLVTLLRRTIPDIELIDAFNDADVKMALMKAEAIVYTIMDEDGNNRSEIKMPQTHVKHNQNIRQTYDALRHLTSRVDFFETRKSFVLVSTLLTWAKTPPPDPDDPETPLTEEDYRRRVPHPEFTAHIQLEKEVLKYGLKHPHHLRAFVIASGVVYGYGENVLHYFFKEAWNNVATSKCVEPGKNLLPLIHGKDLAHVVQVVLDNVKTSPKYLVACDDGPLKLRQLVRNISKRLANGQIEFVAPEILQASPEVSSNALHQFTLNLPIKPYYLSEKVNLRWTSREGILRNGMKRVLREYRDERMLQPIRIIVAGLPQSGKTIIARALAQKYKLHYVSAEEAVAEGIERIEQRAEKAKLDALREENPENNETEEESEDEEEVADEEDEEEEDLDEQMELVQELRQPGGKLPDVAVSRFVHKKLTSKPCQNQGYVLDSYPQTYDQARLLFLGNNDTPVELFEDSDEFINLDDLDERILPDHVFFLNADEEFLTHRVMNQRENALDAVTKRMGLEERFVAALAEYRARTGSSPEAGANSGADNVMQFYEDIATPTHVIDISLDPIIEDEGEPLFDRATANASVTNAAQPTAANQPKVAPVGTSTGDKALTNAPPVLPVSLTNPQIPPPPPPGVSSPSFFISSEKRFTAEEGMPAVLSEISRIVGKVRNYGPSQREFDEDKRRELMDVIEKSKTLSILRGENEKQKQIDQQYREIEWEKKAEHERQELLKMQKRESRHIREYLSKKIMPSVTQALLACVDNCKDDDPVDFIAKYLIENTYTDYSVKDDALDDRIKNTDL